MKQHDCILITADHRRAIQSANEQPQHVNTQYLALKLQWEDWSSKLYIYIFFFPLNCVAGAAPVLYSSVAPLKKRGSAASSIMTKSSSSSVTPTNMYSFTRLYFACSRAHWLPTFLHTKKRKKSCFSFRCGYFLFIVRESLLCWMGKNIPHSLEKLSRNGGEEWCKAWHGGRGGDGEKSSREELKDRQDERLGEPWVRRGLRQQESGAKGKKKKKLGSENKIRIV